MTKKYTCVFAIKLYRIMWNLCYVHGVITLIFDNDYVVNINQGKLFHRLLLIHYEVSD